jgi:competence protein CoiA
LFVALKQDGQYISLLDNYDTLKLKAIRKNETFYCPACHQAVQLKIGQKKVSHFSHYKDSSCTVHFESESETHLNGKRQLFDWLKEQYMDTKLEPYIKSISQRPDILVEDHSREYAIEFQCSRLSDNCFQKRTLSYLKNNISPIWIINHEFLKCVGNQQFEMSPFLWQFLTKRNNHPPLIFFYSPLQHSFLLLSSIIPFSSTLTFGHVDEMKLVDITFRELLHDQPNFHTTQIKNLWLQQKKRYRRQFSIYPQRNQRSLLNALYQNRIAPSLIPPETGLPCKSMFWIHTHSCVWQLWIILDCLLRVKVGEVITFKHVFSAFSKRVKTKEIILRNLPLLGSSSHVSHAVMEYLQCLCSVGILERKSNTEFKKIADFIIPRNNGETYDADRKVLEKMFEKISI